MIIIKQLSIKNDWESYYYYANGEKVDPKEIKEVFLSNEKYKCFTRDFMVPYTDWGHNYYANRTIIYIIVPVNGENFEIEITGKIQQGKIYIA